jgi:TatD DNase family protein
MAVFYDTHAHLDSPDFAGELEPIVARAGAAGIGKIVTIATDFESSRRAIRIAEQFPNIFAAVGWHPSDALKAPDDIRPELRELAGHPKVVALGETGIDYHWLPSRDPKFTSADDEACKRKQADLFRQHLEIAAELGLNCVVHQRDALEDTMALFQPFADRVRAVFHCFADDAATMRRVLGMGSLVSFTGILTFKNGQNIRDTLAATPLGSFMLETDCPYLAPVPYRGKRCEPAHIKETSETAARVKGCTLEELSRATCEAAEGFFWGWR